MSRKVKVGDIFVGGDAPVTVQTMYDIPLGRLEENFEARMGVLNGMGCDIMRFSYPDIREHEMLERAVKLCPMPVVADIHFDWKNALDALDCGVAALRINPGNIGARWKTEEVVRKASDCGAAVRIGLNSGSLPENTEKKKVPVLMADTALEYISWFEALGFYNTVVSLKSSDTGETEQACRLFAAQSDYPLHLGVTEAGGTVSSCVRSTWVLGNLLKDGTGATLRYSITGSIEDEVLAGTELLRTLGLRKGGVRIVSCPTCGRKSFDSRRFLEDVQAELLASGRNVCVAVMGCCVNGPGEARGADIAVSGIGRKIYLYKHGKIYKEVTESTVKEELLKLVREF